jgi:hypothetical protein
MIRDWVNRDDGKWYRVGNRAWAYSKQQATSWLPQGGPVTDYRVDVKGKGAMSRRVLVSCCCWGLILLFTCRGQGVFETELGQDHGEGNSVRAGEKAGEGSTPRSDAVQGATEEGGQPLRLTISPAVSPLTAKSLMLRVCLENVSNDEVRILRPTAFANMYVRFWFYLFMTSSGGHPVPARCGGSLDLRGDRVYLTLGPKEGFFFVLDLQHYEIPQPLEEGKYRIKMVYVNGYGKDCFIGKVESNALYVEVVRAGGS